jgi:hypothetical protein
MDVFKAIVERLDTGFWEEETSFATDNGAQGIDKEYFKGEVSQNKNTRPSLGVYNVYYTLYKIAWLLILFPHLL